MRSILCIDSYRCLLGGHRITRAEDDLTEEEKRMVAVFRALGQTSRYALWKSLAHKCLCQGERGDYCSTLQQKSGLAQSTVSHHLRILVEAGLLSQTKEGTWCCYAVNPRVYEAVQAFSAELNGRD